MSRDWTPEEIQAVSAAMKEAGSMGFEEFSAEVEATTAAKEKVDAFAQIQTDGVHFCPRCGKIGALRGEGALKGNHAVVLPDGLDVLFVAGGQRQGQHCEGENLFHAVFTPVFR